MRRRRAIAGAQTGDSGGAISACASVPCQAPSPKRIAQSRPSAARSTRLLLVSSRSVDGRMRALERRQPRQQPADREGADDGDGHHLAVQAALELLQHRVHALEAVAEQRQQRLALVGQRQAARQAPEQRRAQARLEVLDLRADGVLGDVQFQRRAREAQVAGRGLEGAHRIQ